MKEIKELAWLALICAILAPIYVYSECRDPIKIAIIDTGFGYGSQFNTSHLCKYGHRDFTLDQRFSENFGTVDPVPVDFHQHGTNIAGIIEKQLVGVNFCFVILKTYAFISHSNNILSSIRAINFASNIRINYINYSGGGIELSIPEQQTVKRYIDNGGTFVAAAGNEFRDLAITPYYPAQSDPRVIVVGALSRNGIKLSQSNFGDRVNMWEIGDSVEGNGIVMSGTSQATAIATGKLARAYDRYCKAQPNKSVEKIAFNKEHTCH